MPILIIKAQLLDIKILLFHSDYVLKIPRGQPRLGSIPTSGTKNIKGLAGSANPFFMWKLYFCYRFATTYLKNLYFKTENFLFIIRI